MTKIKRMRRLIKLATEKQNSTGLVFMLLYFLSLVDALVFSLPSFARLLIIHLHSHLFCKLGILFILYTYLKSPVLSVSKTFKMNSAVFIWVFFAEFSPQRIWIRCCEQ